MTKQMKWFVDEDGKQVEVAPEAWVWGVVYKDGTELHQFDNEGVFNRFADIKQDDVEMFVMHKPGTDKRIDMVKSKDMKLIHFYKNIRPDYMTEFVRVYVFGFEGGGKKTLNFILPDDRIVVSDTDVVNLPDFALVPRDNS